MRLIDGGDFSLSRLSRSIQRWLSEIERNRGSYRGKRKTAAKVEELTGWVSERERERTKRSIFAWYLSFSLPFLLDESEIFHSPRSNRSPSCPAMELEFNIHISECIRMNINRNHDYFDLFNYRRWTESL